VAMSNALFPPGTVIPAHPLALDRAGTVDWRAQRALSRYYLAAGAHGLAVGVHTTQFPLHDDRALFADVLRLAVEAVQPRTTTLIAGVTGPVGQAVEEACAARDLGYDAVLLSLHGCAADESEGSLVERASAVGEILPTVAFYMQESVGGRYLSSHYWRRIFDLESTVAVKLAPFDRYRTAEAANAVLSSDRWREITVLTGNDDAIVADLLSEYQLDVAGAQRRLRFAGGLLGQWAVGTAHAVALSGRLAAAVGQTIQLDPADRRAATALTDVNSAIFDVLNRFHGSVAGVNEVLRQQGMLASSRLLPGAGALSPGQQDLIARARKRHPVLLDEEFVASHRDEWLGD